MFAEMSSDLSKEFFDFKQKKVMSNIDSLYLSIKLKSNFNEDGNDKLYDAMTSCLYEEKEKAAKEIEAVVPFVDTIYEDVGMHFLMYGFGFDRYEYDIHKPDKYSFFIMGYQMLKNPNTPQVIVQIRSEALWLNGVDSLVREVYGDLTFFFSAWGIEIEEIKENRIDYAYHTNYIQDPTNYFRTDKIGSIQHSRFERWGLQGAFTSDDKADTDYFTLGRRKSNNVFFRVYNKTKEVIEQGYKQFFFQLWYAEGLINKYDLFCYEKAFVEPSRFKYKHLGIARLQFYLENGTDLSMKGIINNLIDKKQEYLDYEKILNLAEKLTPPLTIILNVELETKRKFYRTIDKGNNALRVKSKNVPAAMIELYRKLDNLQLFHDYLTCNNVDNDGTIRFVQHTAKDENGKVFKNKKDYPTNDFWKRIQSSKLDRRFDKDNIVLVRGYQEELNAELIKTRVANGISTLSLYNHLQDISDMGVQEKFEMMKKIKNISVDQDVLDFISLLNENDMQKAIDYKIKKAPELQSKVTSGKRLTKNRKLKLIDTETGEMTDTVKDLEK